MNFRPGYLYFFPMLDLFFDYLRFELNRAPLTLQAYAVDLEQFKEWLSPENEVDYTTITTVDIRAWLAFRARQGDSPRTLRRKIITLRTLFKWMMKAGYISKSPVADIPLPKLPKPLPDFIKPAEIEESLQSLEEDNSAGCSLKLPDALIIEILYSLGIRRAELVGINNEDISFSKKEIKVTGKRSKQRVIPVPQPLLDTIKTWQQQRDKDQEIPEGENALFTLKGKRITPHKVYEIVHKALSGIDARKKSPHALRHSFASAMLNGGAELDSVREFLGHASLATTQIYTHISLNEIKKAYSLAHPRSNSSDSK